VKNLSAMRWALILGVVGFAAGFFGPMIFSPEANQGPLVGLFIAGPAGVVLGLALYGICRLLEVGAQGQRRVLLGTAALGAVAVVLAVQPEPALRGTLYDADVKSCSSPVDTQQAVFASWEKQMAAVTWAAPRAGWQDDMRGTLASAPGVVVAAELVQQNAVHENRKPWNRGTIFADGWKARSEVKEFYYPAGSCEEFPAGKKIRGFEPHTFGAKIEPPKDWPPRELEQVLNASTFSAVPQAYEAF
jgi:hypothetical protein